MSPPDNYTYTEPTAEMQNPSHTWAYMPGRGYPLKCDSAGGFGSITFASIMPGETVYATIQSRYAANVELKPLRGASIVSADGKKRRTIPVHLPSDPVLIAFQKC